MKLISWNVNGIRAILQKGLPEFWSRENPDIICFQEVKAREEQLVGTQWPPGYHLIWNAATRPGYSGTAIFSRIQPQSVSFGIGSEIHDNEGRVITIELADFYLVNVYVPNSQRDLARLNYRSTSWGPDFLAYLKSLETRKPVVVCGDFNVAHQEIDLARPKDNTKNAGFTPEERADFSRVIDAGFIDTFREFESDTGHYTWWSYMNRARERNIGWRIDYFLISPSLRPKLQRAWTLPEIQGSDHCPVAIELGANLA